MKAEIEMTIDWKGLTRHVVISYTSGQLKTSIYIRIFEGISVLIIVKKKKNYFDLILKK